MKENHIYSVFEIQEIIRHLSVIFDVVRVVYPQETAVLELGEDGSVCRQPYVCFKFWDRDTRCMNCSSMRAVLQGEKQEKYDICPHGCAEETYYVTSHPIRMATEEGELSVVLEILSQCRSTDFLGADGSVSLAHRLEEIQVQLYQDELTGAYNRRYFNEVIFLQRNQNQLGRQVAFIRVDLHNFKMVNDTVGHLAGDQLLQGVSAILQQNIGPNDSVVRMGGDEFLVILVGSTQAQALACMEKLRWSVEVLTEADFGCAYTAQFNPMAGSLADLLQRADEQMYKAKRQRYEQLGQSLVREARR